MFKSILRWLFRVKPAPAPAPAEKPPMAVRNPPKTEKAVGFPVAEAPFDTEKWAKRFRSGRFYCTCDTCDCGRVLVNTGPHGVVSAGMAADRRLTSMEQANTRQAEANRHITGHSVPGILD